jgi:hypothetical protein
MKPLAPSSFGKKSREEKARPVTKESTDDQRPQNSGSMLNQKTFEDYNKEKPDFNDPNQNESGKKLGAKTKELRGRKANETKSNMKKPTKTYTCPMHPEVKSDKEGKCPKCSMKLVEKK